MVVIKLKNFFCCTVHKKKKRLSHKRGDQAKLATLRRFSNMVDGLFDQNVSEGKAKNDHELN